MFLSCRVFSRQPNLCLSLLSPVLYLFATQPRKHQPSHATATLHAGRGKDALLPGIGLPAAGQSLTTVLLSKLLHASLQLGAEVANKTLDGPGESLTESYIICISTKTCFKLG